MLDSNRALHPAETLAAICVCGERDLHAGQRHELRRGGLDDLAAHSLRNGFGQVCRSANHSGHADAALHGRHYRPRRPAAPGDDAGFGAGGRHSRGNGACLPGPRAGVATLPDEYAGGRGLLDVLADDHRADSGTDAPGRVRAVEYASTGWRPGWLADWRCAGAGMLCGEPSNSGRIWKLRKPRSAAFCARCAKGWSFCARIAAWFFWEIGRASCRERAYTSVVAVS